MKNRFAIAALVAIILASFSYTVFKIKYPKRSRHLNVFIVSFCSFRMQLLSRYGGKDPNLLPAMEKFMRESSFIFDNVYNGMPWTGVFTFTRMRIPWQTFRDLGYHFLGSVEGGHLERIPNRRSREYLQIGHDINDNDYEKILGNSTQYLGSVATTPRMQPFFGVAHYKYLHYPLIDRFNADSNWDRFLSVKEINQLSEYLNHPEKYPEKLPFLMMIANDPHIALVHPEIKPLHWPEDPASLKKLTGLLTNPRFLKAWKNSPGFKSDLALLEKVYAGNAQYFDQALAPALNLWGDKYLQDNSVVIMIADHGELHMERDQLTHGGSLYDEGLHVPMAIRFPRHWGRTQVIKDQMHFATVAKMVDGILKGEIREDNLQEEVTKLQDHSIVLRDCLNTQRGLRVDNKYKYIVNIASGERFLYDLKKDPGELNNIASAQPDLADNMEASYWENYPRFSDIYPYHCVPWVRAGQK